MTELTDDELLIIWRFNFAKTNKQRFLDIARAAIAADRDLTATLAEPADAPAAVAEGPSDEELRATINKATVNFPPSHPQAQPLNVLEYQLALELCKARAVLARWGQPPAPPAEGEVAEMLLEIEQLAHEANLRGDATCYAWHRTAGLLERLARWGNHFPDATKMVPPSEEEATGVIDAIADCLQADAPSSTILDRIAELLAHHAAPVPVPVAERLPGPEDCVPHPRTKLGSWCWGFERYKVSLARPARWRLMHMEAIELEASHWLPAHALPLPAPQGGEVES